MKERYPIIIIMKGRVGEREGERGKKEDKDLPPRSGQMVTARIGLLVNQRPTTHSFYKKNAAFSLSLSLCMCMKV